MKNKTQYVRIAGCTLLKGWYDNLIESDILIPTKGTDDGLYYECILNDKLIKKSDCEPVQMKELDKDIDGEYLECNTTVTGYDSDGESQGLMNYLYPYDDGFICLIQHEIGSTGMLEDKFEKIFVSTVKKYNGPEPKEEKKVDLIAEVWNKYKDDIKEIIAANPWQYNLCEYSFDWVKTLAAAIKQHMEDKKG